MEDKILEEIYFKWNEYAKDKKNNTDGDEYFNMLKFLDSLFPNVNLDEIDHYTITKTIIITHLRDELIKDIIDKKYENIIHDKYNKIKK